MGALEMLNRWLSPITDPLEELPAHLSQIQQNHLSSLDSLEQVMTDLTDAPASEAFTGTASSELMQAIEDFLQTERMLSGMGASPSVLDDVQEALDECETEIETATEDAAASLGDDEILIEVTEAVDVTTVAQGGVDVIEDVPALILTVIVGALVISTLVTLGWALYHAIEKLINVLHQLGDQPLPSVPPLSPATPPPDVQKWLNTTLNQLGLANLANAPVNSLSSEQVDQVVKELLKQFPEFTEKELRDFINSHPDLTLEQLLQLLYEKARIRKFRDQVQAQLDALPNDKANAALRASLEALLRKINNFERVLDKIKDPTKAQGQINGLINNIKGAWGEWQLALPYLLAGTLVSFGTKYTYNGEKAEADLVVKDENGNLKWIEVKNVKPADLENIPEKWDELKAQIERELRVAKGNGFTSVEIDFPQGLDPEKVRELEELASEDGINLTINTTGTSVPPLVP